MRKADSVAARADELVRSLKRALRVEIVEAAQERDNLAASASARAAVYETIRKRCAAAAKRLDRILSSANDAAGREAADEAADQTGLAVKYSPRRAEAVAELVTPAQGENLAAVFTDRMAKSAIDALRSATVAALRSNAVSGGSMKDLRKDLAARWTLAAKQDPVFTDASGRRWETGAYLQMNVRTNSMRIYNDCLADDVARATGSDLMRVSSGGDPDCDCCAAWEGVIVSLSGKTKGFPTYEQAREAGVFHPNCTHTLEYVDETADADEIALQGQFPFQGGAASSANGGAASSANGGAASSANGGAGAKPPSVATDPAARKRAIDEERYKSRGLSAADAALAVSRDRLEAAIRNGLLRDDARDLVDALSDAQVRTLCATGNAPRFEPFKPTKKELRDGAKETWRKGKRGGVVHVAKDADLAHLLAVCGVEPAKDGEESQTDKDARLLYSKAKAIEKSGKSDGATLTLSPLSDATMEEIRKACGIAPKTNAPTVSGNAIVHAFNRHGAQKSSNGKTRGEKDKGQLPILPEDFFRIPEIIAAHDSVEKGSVSTKERLESARFVKAYADGTVYSVFVVSGTLDFKTMWKKKPGK